MTAVPSGQQELTAVKGVEGGQPDTGHRIVAVTAVVPYYQLESNSSLYYCRPLAPGPVHLHLRVLQGGPQPLNRVLARHHYTRDVGKK